LGVGKVGEVGLGVGIVGTLSREATTCFFTFSDGGDERLTILFARAGGDLVAIEGVDGAGVGSDEDC
jgi:hypothetical protein